MYGNDPEFNAYMDVIDDCFYDKYGLPSFEMDNGYGWYGQFLNNESAESAFQDFLISQTR